MTSISKTLLYVMYMDTRSGFIMTSMMVLSLVKYTSQNNF